MRHFFILFAIAGLLINPSAAEACTGITLKSKDGTTIVARTIEWGGSNLNSQYVVVPRGYTERSYTPNGVDGMTFTARYGYVGLAVEQKEFIAEGLNEVGLSAGLFYFPKYGEYEKYNAAVRDKSISDLQLVSWLLGECSNVEEVKEAVKKVHVINIDPRASTVHWRFAEPSGRQLVLEIIKGELHFYENTLGVLTNSPSFEWHLTNLNNYVNLFPGTAPNQQETALETVFQCFQILNNFDIPVGIEFPLGQVPCDIPSATQWTSVTDMRNHVIYYRTMYNSIIRNIDLRSIDFSTVRYRAVSMDGTKRQAVETIKIE